MLKEALTETVPVQRPASIVRSTIPGGGVVVVRRVQINMGGRPPTRDGMLSVGLVASDTDSAWCLEPVKIWCGDPEGPLSAATSAKPKLFFVGSLSSASPIRHQKEKELVA